MVSPFDTPLASRLSWFAGEPGVVSCAPRTTLLMRHLGYRGGGPITIPLRVVESDPTEPVHVQH